MSTEIDRYNDQLLVLRDRSPDHSLLPQLEQGHSYTRAILLRRAIEALPPAPVNTSTDIDYRADGDPIVQRLQRQIQYLFGSRAKLSNQYAGTSSVSERKAINQSIRPINDKISKILIQIDDYREKKVLPKNAEDPDYDIPEDPLQRHKKKMSIRSCKSRVKKQLRKLTEDNGDPEEIAGRRALLQQYEIHLMYIDEADRD